MTLATQPASQMTLPRFTTCVIPCQRCGNKYVTAVYVAHSNRPHYCPECRPIAHNERTKERAEGKRIRIKFEIPKGAMPKPVKMSENELFERYMRLEEAVIKQAWADTKDENLPKSMRDEAEYYIKDLQKGLKR